MFTITIILTKLGYENIEQVLSAVFRWVAYEFETICSQTSSVQIRGSVLDPYSMAFWIQIQIGMSNTDPDPGSVQLSGQFCPMQQLWSTFLKFNRLLIFLASKLNSDPYAILMLDTDRVFHIDRKGWSQGTWLMDLRSGVHRPVICSSYYLIITSKEVWGTIKFNKTFSCVAPGAYITDCRTYLPLQRILQVFLPTLATWRCCRRLALRSASSRRSRRLRSWTLSTGTRSTRWIMWRICARTCTSTRQRDI